MSIIFPFFLSVHFLTLNGSLCKFGSHKRIQSLTKILEVIDCLREGELSVSRIAEVIQISQANLSQHLAMMREKGILITRREGTNVYYRLSNPKITQACDLMRQVLLEHLEAGAELVETSRR